LQPADFVQVSPCNQQILFQSDLSYGSVVDLKSFYHFIYICGLDGFQHVLIESSSTSCSSWILSLVRIIGAQNQEISSIVMGLKSQFQTV